MLVKNYIFHSFVFSLLLASASSAAGMEFDIEIEKSKLSQKVFEHYDADKNGLLAKDEYRKFSDDAIARKYERRAVDTLKYCDKNSDGQIDLTESPTRKQLREVFRKQKGTTKRHRPCYLERKLFKTYDKNSDGLVTKKELIDAYSNPTDLSVDDKSDPIDENRQRLERFKDRLKDCDTNSDEKISFPEATSEKCRISSDEFFRHSSDINKSFSIADIKEIPERNKDTRINVILGMCDRNHDKELNLIEATSLACMFSYEKFKDLDKNHNGRLTFDEVRNLYEQKKSHVYKISKDLPPEVQITFALHRCDKNKDKKVTKSEASKCELSLKIFEKYDSDKSETIETNDLKEMYFASEFESIDTNSDDRISKKEFDEGVGNRCRVF